MNRRDFLAAVGGASLASAGAAGAPSRIVDTHTHFYDPSRPQGVPWPPKSDPVLYRTVLPKEYEAFAKPLGVTGTVVIEASPWIEDNQWVLDLAKDDPFLLGLVGHLEPGKPDFRQNFERFRRDRLFLGIRCGGNVLARALSDGAVAADFERLTGANLEVDVLGPAAMLPDVVRFAARFANLRIVVDHLPFEEPRDPAERAAFHPALRELGRHPNVYAKISWVLRNVNGRVPLALAYYLPALDELWQSFGPDRVVYGSNWPVSGKVAPYRAVQNIVMEYFAAKGADALERYFWRNAREAYRWKQRA